MTSNCNKTERTLTLEFEPTMDIIHHEMGIQIIAQSLKISYLFFFPKIRLILHQDNVLNWK